MAEYGNLVHCTSATTGTGDFTLAAVNGKQTFNDAFGTGGTDKFYYFIANRGAAEWEVGTGHLSDAVTLVRDTVLASSNSNSAVNFSAGTKDVSNDIPAAARALRSEVMLKADYDPNTVGGDAFDMDEMVDGSSKVAMTTTERSKLGNIEDSADVTDAANVGSILNTTSKSAPVDADRVFQGNSASSFALVYSTWTQVKAFLKTYFDTLYAALSGAVFTGAIQAPSIELGHASDTTLTRVSAGVVAVEGNNLIRANDTATTSATGVVEKATDAEVYSGASDKFLAADHIESASAEVTLTDGSSPTFDWDAGVNRVWTMSANRTLPNPTNGQPGTYRTIRLLGNNTTDRALTFGANYVGDLPTLTDIDSAQHYLLTIRCLTTTTFIVTAQKASTF